MGGRAASGPTTPLAAGAPIIHIGTERIGRTLCPAIGRMAWRFVPERVAPDFQQQSECMLQTHSPANPGRTFFPFQSDKDVPAASAAPFQVPLNLSPDEIRDLVRELLG